MHRKLEHNELQAYEKAKKYLSSIFGQPWLEGELRSYLKYIKQLKRIYKRNYLFYIKEGKYHPLAKLWFSNSSFDILRMIELRTVLEDLRNSEGFDNKVKKIKCSPKEFDKLLFELRIAFEFHSLGWNVIFPETPDLITLSNGLKLHIECKKKDNYGMKEKLRRNIYKNISTNVMNKLEKNLSYYIILIKCRTHIEPKDSPILEKSIINAIKESKNSISDEKFEITIIQNNITNIPYIDYPINTEKEINERVVYSLTKEITGDPIIPDFYASKGITPRSDNISLSNFKFIGFSSNESIGRFASIENSFNDAIEQIQEGAYGLIYIELDSDVSYIEIKEISERLKGKLFNYPRIFAAILTREIIEKSDNGLYIKGTNFIEIANKSIISLENLSVPGIKREKERIIEHDQIGKIRGHIARKYSPDGFFRPFSKEGMSLLVVFKPYFQDRIQYYVDTGEALDKNRCSLLHDGKSNLTLAIYSYNRKYYSLNVSLEKQNFFDNYHAILCTLNPLKGELRIDIDGKMFKKNVDTFYLDDIFADTLIGTDFSKSFFAKMDCATVGVWSRVLSEEDRIIIMDWIAKTYRL
jgi:hypothetical protein